MRIQPHASTALLATVLLGLAACDRIPVAPEAAPVGIGSRAMVQAQSAQPSAGRSQCTNNLKQIGLGVHNRPLARIIAPSQVVVDQEGRGIRIHAQYDMSTPVEHDQRGESTMCGSARLDGPDEWVTIWPMVGTLQVEPDGRIAVRYEGEAEICSGPRKECETVAMVGTIHQDAADDDPIWQFHSGDVYSSAFPAQTQFVFPGPAKDDEGIR